VVCFIGNRFALCNSYGRFYLETSTSTRFTIPLLLGHALTFYIIEMVRKGQ